MHAYTPMALVALAEAYRWLDAWLALYVLPDMLDCRFDILIIPVCAADNSTFLPTFDFCKYRAISLCIIR